MKKRFVLAIIITLIVLHQSKAQNIHPKLLPYYQVLKTKGLPPVKFMLEKINTHDLLIFDDGLHLAQEPFDFYQQLIKNKAFAKTLNYVFLEILPVTAQRHLDAFLNSPNKNQALLYPAFQQTFDAYPINYKTYFDLLNTIWEVNQLLADKDKIRVLGVDIPLLWEGIHTKEDWVNYRKVLKGRDYNLYQVILGAMSKFRKSQKGIFLTNTRHAYKGIKNKQGKFFWNCSTFFTQRNPGKTYSIRIHNVSLNIYKKLKKEAQTTQGLDQVQYRWIRMENGLWDAAFKAYGKQPVAIPLKSNVFGQAAYTGNHSLTAKSGQSMYNAYDALVILAPLEKLHLAAKVGAVYTPKFQKEMIRRLKILNSPAQIKALLKENDVNSLEKFVEELSKDIPVRPNSLVKTLGNKNAWK